jgi:hypothetical protein
MSDCQRKACQAESWTDRGVRLCVEQLCQLACGVQMWSTCIVVDSEGEGHAGSYGWIRSDERQALGRDRRPKSPGD